MKPRTVTEWVKAIEAALEQTYFAPGTREFLVSVADQAWHYKTITDNQAKWVEIRINQHNPNFFDHFYPADLPMPNRTWKPPIADAKTKAKAKPKAQPTPKAKDNKEEDSEEFYNPMEQLAE